MMRMRLYGIREVSIGRDSTFILLEKIPAEGDSFDYAGMTFTVEKMRRQRILTLRAVPAAPEEVTQE